MIYIYDIILNFHENLYEFYEWNKNDKLINIKKIPLFRVDSNTLRDIKNNNVSFDTEFLDLLKEKTEYYNNREVKKMKYCFLLTDYYQVIAINISKKILYSSLAIDEELDILENNDLKIIKLKYKIIDSKNINIFKTRNNFEQEKYIKKELKKLEKENDIDKIKYLYFECFNKKENNIKEIFNQLYNSINDKNIFLKLNKFFKTLTFN